jgi:hypothetical protein
MPVSSVPGGSWEGGRFHMGEVPLLPSKIQKGGRFPIRLANNSPVDCVEARARRVRGGAVTTRSDMTVRGWGGNNEK